MVNDNSNCCQDLLFDLFLNTEPRQKNDKSYSVYHQACLYREQNTPKNFLDLLFDFLPYKCFHQKTDIPYNDHLTYICPFFLD